MTNTLQNKISVECMRQASYNKDIVKYSTRHRKGMVDKWKVKDWD